MRSIKNLGSLAETKILMLANLSIIESIKNFCCTHCTEKYDFSDPPGQGRHALKVMSSEFFPDRYRYQTARGICPSLIISLTLSKKKESRPVLILVVWIRIQPKKILVPDRPKMLDLDPQ
jgi:hypothetical protein